MDDRPRLRLSNVELEPGAGTTCDEPGAVFGVVSLAGRARAWALVVPGVVLGIFLGVARHEWDGVAFYGWNCSIWANGVEWYR